MDFSQSSFRVQGYYGYEETYSDYGIIKPGKKTANSTGLTGQLVISFALGFAALFLFCLLRTRWVVMFAPRTKLRRHTPPILSTTFFGWIPQLLRIPEAEVLDCVGLDAAMLLRFYHMSIKLFSCCMIPGLLVILPVNYYSAEKNSGPAYPNDPDDDGSVPSYLDGNTEFQGTSLLYLFTQFTFTWVFSILTMYAIWHTYEGYIAIRRKYMMRRSNSITNRSVMVVGLPSHLQNDRALATFYESLGAGTVESAHVCRHVRTLKRMVEQRAHALRMLEDVYSKYYGNPSDFPGYDPDKVLADNDRLLTDAHAEDEDHDESTNENSSLLRPQGKKRPTMRLGFLGLFGKKVDKIDHCREIFVTLDRAVQKMRLSRIFATTSIGFVTFEDMRSAQTLAQTVNTQETLSCETTLAPEPRDVFWDNLNLPPSELGVRSVVVNTTVFFLIFFWSGPIGVFSSFLNLESLEKLIPGVSKIAAASPVLKSLIQGFLPTVGVTVFLAVVPKILGALCESQGIQSRSGVARSLYNKYFTFILFNVVLVFTVVGTWAQAVNKVYHDIGELTLLLAASLPRVAPFFVNYVILKGVGLFPLQLLQIGDVIEQTFRGILSKTPRDYAEARAPPELHHGVVYSNATLMFVIVLIYSCIKPLILVFGVIFFVLGYVVFKYQLLYVFFHPYESGGRTWPMVYNRITLGLLIFQLTMLGLFMLKQSYILGALLSPLPIGTVWFWYWTTGMYKDSAEFIPLELLRPSELEAEIGAHNAYSAQEEEASAVTAAAIGSSNQVPGHVLISIDGVNNQQSKASNGKGNGKGNGVVVGTAAAVVTPGGTQRPVPKSVVEDDDYQAIPDRYTDYRQPPMTLFPGVLNSGMRQYNHPAMAGPLPTLWLPLRKGDAGKNPNQDEESRIGAHYTDSDTESEHHVHEHVEAALARPPLMLPTQGSDEPQSYDEGDNLVGGGQDEDIPGPEGGRKNTTSTTADVGTATTSGSPGRAPQAIPATPAVETAAASSSSAQPDATVAAAAAEEDSKRNSAVEGINDVYYHHPEKRESGTTAVSSSDPPGTSERVRTVQGQGSSGNLLRDQTNSAAEDNADRAGNASSNK
ncbi:hypothetical protein BC939DRAFT_469949 [Gamsiella multidivaricata]|uniref:uncharacterized protein n=1 Tax=Gamsiella multidivaricata TaxID=101098 RepID=UPI00221E54B9|nr:uncharacterized protein BC939DRAFT_469949 [Gamsiella multidivaricata]KAI7816206.1 hypothetical protein BC939DRAFT_469949 [Gamsiella multidivaricata]